MTSLFFSLPDKPALLRECEKSTPDFNTRLERMARVETNHVHFQMVEILEDQGDDH